jgi:hypothetical protein
MHSKIRIQRATPITAALAVLGWMGCSGQNPGIDGEVGAVQSALTIDDVKVTASDGAATDLYGGSVAVGYGYWDFWAVAGAENDDVRGLDSGSIYLYFQQWRQEDTLEDLSSWLPIKYTAPDGAAGDHFGHAVALFWDVMAVSADDDDDRGSSSGSVYVFSRSGPTWSYSTKFTAADGAAADFFGDAVTATSNGSLQQVIVGAPGDDDKGSSSGSVYIFESPDLISTWTQTKKLTAPDGHSVQGFGKSLSSTTSYISNANTSLVVGAPYDHETGLLAGAVYVYDRHHGGDDQWGLLKKVIPDDAHALQKFGMSVALVSRTTLVVGAPYDDTRGTMSGAVYVFSRDLGGTNHWGQVAKLSPSDGASGDRFGQTVGYSEGYIVVGAPYDDDKGTDSGTVYLYGLASVQAGDTTSYSKIWDATVGANDNFGSALGNLGQSSQGAPLAVGVALDDDRGTDAGAMVVFDTGHAE